MSALTVCVGKMTLTATRMSFAHKDLPNASSKAPFPISALALMSNFRQTSGVMSESEGSARRAAKARVPRVPSLVFDIEVGVLSTSKAVSNR